MSEAKKSLLDSQSYVITEMAPAPKSKSVKKTVVIAGTGVLTVALVLTAVLIGMRLLAESHKNILMFSQQMDHNIRGGFSTPDDDSNVEQYSMRDNKYDTLIIQDSKRDVQVIKLGDEDSVKCYVIPLTRNTAGETSRFPSKVLDQQNFANITEIVYSASVSEIRDTSFLGKTARNVCAGYSTFWATPNCAGASGPDNKMCCGIMCSCCPRRCRFRCWRC